MKDARFTIPTPALLAKVVDMLDQVPMDDRGGLSHVNSLSDDPGTIHTTGCH